MASPAPSSAARALRDAFGDRKPPDISRKITACVACRKQKIKCYMTNSKPPCTRCKKRGLSCTVNRSLQMLLEGDITWKHAIEHKVRRLEEAIGKIAPELQGNLENSDQSMDVLDSIGILSEGNSAHQNMGQQTQAWELVADPKGGAAAIPASCVSEVSPNASPTLHRPGDDSESDLISRGLISVKKAEELFDLYHQRLDHFVCRILTDHGSLASIRASSSFLTTAVCTVGALLSASPEYQICYDEFIKQASVHMCFGKKTFDDVRALLIGAFWLNDISWTLVGAAVRIANEINLHRCISKAPHVKRECYERTRLYLLVYVCDHHFSIAYGRPPMTREFTSLSSPRSFLDSEYVIDEDARLISEVELWSISSRIFDAFGVDTEKSISNHSVSQIRRLSIALDTWRVDWNEALAVNSNVGGYPQNGIDLHFHFARLYLCSHVFRGASNPKDGPATHEISPEFEEFANAAIYSATSIVRILIADQEVQARLDSLPTYFDTMIASTVVFLLKMHSSSSRSIAIDQTEIMSLLNQLTSTLKNVASQMHSQHLLSNIASSVERLVDRYRQPAPQDGNDQMTLRSQDGVNVQEWVMNPSDSMFWENYDFLYQQDGIFNFDHLEFNQTPLEL